MLTESKYLSRIIWGAGFLLVVAAFVVPGLDSSSTDGAPGADEPLHAFDERVQAFEQRLNAGEPTSDDAERALEFAPFLKARALSGAGSLSPEEVRQASERLQDYQDRIAAEVEMDSRRRLHHRRTALILNETERIDASQAHDALQSVRDAYDEHFGLDPGLMTETDDDGEARPVTWGN